MGKFTWELRFLVFAKFLIGIVFLVTTLIFVLSAFVIWIERLKKAAMNHEGYRDEQEKEIVPKDIELAREFYLECIKNSTMP